jgi:toxin ParE1/3/4
MSGYLISSVAAKDLEDIWLYTLENWSKDQADRYFNLIMDEIERIAVNPDSGTNFSHIRPGFLRTRIMSHLIIHKVDKSNAEVHIIRILHQRIDVPSQLED